MMKNIFSRTNIIAFLLLAIMFVPVATLASGNLDPNLGLDYAGNIGLGETSATDVVTNIIQVILGLLGLIAVVIILIGGFQWMTAGGSEEKVKKGRTWIINGAIGLIIVLAAFSIAKFVIDTTKNATGLN